MNDRGNRTNAGQEEKSQGTHVVNLGDPPGGGKWFLLMAA
jgi:hypothetical protein